MKKQAFSVLLLAFALLLCACTPSDTESSAPAESSAPERITYTVEVLTEGGMPLAEVRVDVYTDETLTNRIRASETGENGTVSFEAEQSDSYVAVLSNLPYGYDTKQMFSITETTRISLKGNMRNGDDLSNATARLGDIVRDCTVTAVDGTEYKFSELLSTKKAIVLNFWFENCGPCKMEFPFFQKAYEAYSDDVVVLAINPLDGTKNSIAAYASDLGLTFPMAKGASSWAQYMSLKAYPTTVVIDRYGMICMKHGGSVTEEGVFEQIFAHFTADDYKQQTFRNLSDLLG